MDQCSKYGGNMMFKKYFLLLTFILILVIPLAFAENNTTFNETLNNTSLNLTNITPQETMPLPEEFYGDVTYSDGTKVESGNIIKAINQKGIIVGNFTMVYNGTYGDSYKSAPRLIANANTNDILTFYVNDVKSSMSIKFDSAGIKRADVVIPLSAKPTPVPTTPPTPEPTTIIPTEITPEPTPVIVTTETTVIPTTITPTPSPTSQPEDPIPKFAGVLLIAVAICIFGSILTYYILTKKMKREDEEEIIL